jgi:2-dehydro-3-deoxyphosphogluconate aldolase/(4S)-4-hydroxy-2-oxoglutarate aldolase
MPIVTLDDAAHAHPLADALLAGGISCVEVTLRTPAGIRAVERLAGREKVLVGAGTVVNAAQVDLAADAGAAFVVSPGLGLDVLERARERGLAVLPGVATPSEVQAAVLHGLERVKLFPAGVLGGLGLIDAIAGPFPRVSFMPSGGVSAANLGAYLAHPAVFSAGCSWIATRADIAAGRFDHIGALAAAATSAVGTSVQG